MTLINVFRAPKRVVLFTDTLASRNNEPAGAVSKVDFLPHLHAAVATRGRTLVHSDALMGLNLLLPLEGGLESVPDELPGHLQAWRAIREQEFEAEGRDAGDLTSVIFVAGWSRAEKCIRAWRFHADQDFEPEDLPEGFTLEPDVAGRPMPKNIKPDQMVQAAVIQKKALDRQHATTGDGGPCIGGEVWACEITFTGANFRRVYEFKD